MAHNSRPRADAKIMYYEVVLANGLNYILGFKNDVLLNTHTAEAMPNLNRGIYRMMIYVDFCEEIHVGDKLVPMLRTVPAEAMHYGQVKTVTYDSPMYTRVNKSHISTAEIMICDMYGKEIPFVEGNSLMALHFKPIQT